MSRDKERESAVARVPRDDAPRSGRTVANALGLSAQATLQAALLAGAALFIFCGLGWAALLAAPGAALAVLAAARGSLAAAAARAAGRLPRERAGWVAERRGQVSGAAPGGRAPAEPS